jgi:flagellum-specific ATP synthase
MAAVVSEDHMAKASRFRALWSHKREKQDALDFGAYSPGRDSVLDEALQKAPAMDSLLRQGTYECVDFEASLRKLNNVM